MNDRDALPELRLPSGGDRETTVAHYLYFSAKRKAKAAVAALRKQGFLVELRPGADDGSWLVLAKHRMIPAEEAFGTLRAMFEDLARRGGGEYDGWEAEVQHGS